MKLNEFVTVLQSNPEANLRVVLPSGETIPEHFHITEVGRLEKNFIDCGGTKRRTVSCVMQAWTADDIDHRLTAGKLARIINLAGDMLGSDTLSIDVEYGKDVISHYVVENTVPVEGALRVELSGKRTACLAMDNCLVVAPSRCISQGCC